MGSPPDNMLQAFEANGLWWLPDNPTDRLPGILHFTPTEGATLDLWGTFQYSSPDGPHETPIIHGITFTPSDFTLLDTFRSRSGYSRAAGSEELRSSSYHIGTVIAGYKYPNQEDILFSQINVGITGLEEWLGLMPFDTDSAHSEVDGQSRLRLNAIAEQPPWMVFAVPLLDATVGFWHGVTYGLPTIQQLHWEHNAYLSIQPSQPRTLEWFRSTLTQLQRLLCLLMGAPVYLTRIGARGNDRGVSIVFFQPGADARARPLRQWEFILGFQDVRNDFASLLRNWSSVYELLTPVVDLFMGALYGVTESTSLYFLMLVQALETYNRRRSRERYASQEDCNRFASAMLNALPNNTPPALRQSLRTRFKYLGEHSLRKRLEAMLSSLSPVIIEELFKRTPVDEIVSTIVDNRNYLTHYDEDLRSALLSDADLYRTAQIMKVLLAVLLLRDVGLSEQVIHGRVKNRPHFYVPQAKRTRPASH